MIKHHVVMLHHRAKLYFCSCLGRVLSRHDIRGMPVVDEEGKVLGLISCKEVRKHFW